MGLWLKCPKCQAANPLDLKSCQECNASLENLSAADRVYILGNAAPAAPKAEVSKAAAKAAPAATKAASAPKKAAAKAKPKPPPEEMDLEVIASTEPPPRRAKGPKGRKKKK